MQFVISRARLVNDMPHYATVVLGHHIENAARAKVHASWGRRETARWYGEQARQDLASYLKVRQIYQA